MVLGLGVGYVAYGGMPWMQSVFYGIGAAIIAIIAVAAYRLARGTNKRDPLLWVVRRCCSWRRSGPGTELATLFLVAGLVVLLVRAWPGPRRAGADGCWWDRRGAADRWPRSTPYRPERQPIGGNLLLQILPFFAKAGSFVFGSGLAIVPFLQQGVVHDFGWLTEHQFLDAVAVALITPGPVVITVAFIGYLVAGLAGAVLAAAGIFLPVYFFTIVPAPWFRDTGTIRNSVRSPPAPPPQRAAPSPARSSCSAAGDCRIGPRPGSLSLGLVLLVRLARAGATSRALAPESPGFCCTVR